MVFLCVNKQNLLLNDDIQSRANISRFRIVHSIYVMMHKAQALYADYWYIRIYICLKYTPNYDIYIFSIHKGQFSTLWICNFQGNPELIGTYGNL